MIHKRLSLMDSNEFKIKTTECKNGSKRLFKSNIQRSQVVSSHSFFA
jgi:hypothetical protein